MSDEFPSLTRPDPPRSWRDLLRDWAEALDLTPGRLLVGAVVLVIAGLGAWKLLAPPPTPAEMRLPFASSTTAAAGAGGGAGAAGSAAASASSSSTVVGAGEDVVVHVAGAVVAPGIQRLSDGARVVDAVDAAGGTRPEADVARINLAALLEDGQQVYVPVAGEQIPVPAGSSVGGAAAGPSATAPLDLNTATEDELDDLPGIGPAIASAIVTHRERAGPFATVEALLDVRGIGDAKLEQIRPLVAV